MPSSASSGLASLDSLPVSVPLGVGIDLRAQGSFGSQLRRRHCRLNQLQGGGGLEVQGLL